MKLSEYKSTFYFHSGQTSDVARQLSFAGIATVWLLGNTSLSGITSSRHFVLALLFFAFSLCCDLLQYVISSFIWWRVSRYFEKRLAGDPEIMVSKYLSTPGWIFWGLKLVFVILGYWVVVLYLIKALN